MLQYCIVLHSLKHCSSGIKLMADQIYEWSCKMQFSLQFGQSNFLAYMMHWLRKQEFQLPPLATRNTVHCLRPCPPSLAVWKTEGRAWKIRSCATAALLYCLCSSCINNILQEAYPTTEELQKQTPDKRQTLIVAPETKLP